MRTTRTHLVLTFEADTLFGDTFAVLTRRTLSRSTGPGYPVHFVAETQVAMAPGDDRADAVKRLRARLAARRRARQGMCVSGAGREGR